MTPEQWRRIKAIVFEASAMDSTARVAFVARSCVGDEELREVSSLLESMDQAGGRFDAPLVDPRNPSPVLQSLVGAGGLEPELSDMIGRRIGPYEVRREVGRGGMGAVYLASRADREFTQDVALKIIKRGMDTDAIVRRFRTERQILAGLNHPWIARLLDGGSTPDGLPYLVMEYVEGRPITDYCEEHRLTIAERLVLFRKVCGAVAYAHQHLVVHRDIKPSNVLVSSTGEPKLLDFGLAKILEADSGGDTQTAGSWMTPEFASPEQVRGERVTTVSDVYGLGILLYELLSGRRPFDSAFADRSELLRAMGEREPEKPSSVVAPTLRRALRGDLDNIVLKAIDKDPSRRYPGAQALAEDLFRYLERLPVSARRDTFSYRAAKFVRRHRAAVLSATVVGLTLIAATGITAAQARVARRARADAERRFKDVRQLANAFLFDFHDAIAALPGSTTAREMVVRTARTYLDSLAHDAGDDRELLTELSTSYLKLGDVLGRPSASRTGDTDGALASYTQSLALRRRVAAADPSNLEFQHNVAFALVRMGPILQVRGDPAGAAERTREAMQIMDRLLASGATAEMRRNGFRAPLNLGDALYDLGDYDAALAMFQKALRVAETARLDPPEADFRHRMAVARERLGIIFLVEGEPQKALDSHLDALANEQAMRAEAPDSADYLRLEANGHYYVGDALAGLHRYPEALASEHRALEMYEALFRADPRNVGAMKDIGGTTQKIAEILLAQGEQAAAQPVLQRTVSIRRELAERDKGSIEYLDDLADSLTLSGESLLATRDEAGAIARFDEARAIREPILGSRPQQAVYGRGLARLYEDLGEACALRASRLPGRHDATADWREARGWYQRALQLWLDLAGRHALWANERGRPDEAARGVARCELALGR